MAKLPSPPFIPPARASPTPPPSAVPASTPGGISTPPSSVYAFHARIRNDTTPSPREAIGVSAIPTSSSGPDIGYGAAPPPRTGIGVFHADLPSRTGIGVSPATAGLGNANLLAGSAYAGVYPISTASMDYDFSADSPDNPIIPIVSPSTASFGSAGACGFFIAKDSSFGFDADNPRDYIADNHVSFASRG